MDNTVKLHRRLLTNNSTHKEEDERLVQPYLHIARGAPSPAPERIMRCFNHWLKLSEEPFNKSLEFGSMFGNCFLLIDDIQDNSSLRRGLPAAHLIYGIERTLAAAYVTMTLCMKSFEDRLQNDVMQVGTNGGLESHRGQTTEIYWRDNYICPTEQDYMKMVRMKTASLIRSVMEVMQLSSKDKTDYSKLINLMGVYFQIHDDYGNLRFQHYKDRKGYCEDLTEGKFSFPIIHAINSHPEDERVLNIVKQRTTDDEVKKTCVKILEEFGSFEYTARVLQDMYEEIKAETKRLGGNPLIEDLFKDVKIVGADSKVTMCA